MIFLIFWFFWYFWYFSVFLTVFKEKIKENLIKNLWIIWKIAKFEDFFIWNEIKPCVFFTNQFYKWKNAFLKRFQLFFHIIDAFEELLGIGILFKFIVSLEKWDKIAEIYLKKFKLLQKKLKKAKKTEKKKVKKTEKKKWKKLKKSEKTLIFPWFSFCEISEKAEFLIFFIFFII